MVFLPSVTKAMPPGTLVHVIDKAMDLRGMPKSVIPDVPVAVNEYYSGLSSGAEGPPSSCACWLEVRMSSSPVSAATWGNRFLPPPSASPPRQGGGGEGGGGGVWGAVDRLPAPTRETGPPVVSIYSDRERLARSPPSCHGRRPGAEVTGEGWVRRQVMEKNFRHMNVPGRLYATRATRHTDLSARK